MTIGTSKKSTRYGRQRAIFARHANDLQRGFVPTLKVAAADGKTIVIRESSIIVNFLFDLALTLPSPYPETATAIIPRPVTLEDCQRRARGALLNDMFEAKVIPMVYQFLGLEDYAQGEDEESVVEEYIQIFSSEVEPHLIDANPFFGNSPEVTFVEIMTGGFVLKLYKYLDYRLIPERIGKGISETCPKFDAWAKAVRQSQVVQAGILDAEGSVVSHDEKVSHNETLDNEHGMVG